MTRLAGPLVRAPVARQRGRRSARRGGPGGGTHPLDRRCPEAAAVCAEGLCARLTPAQLRRLRIRLKELRDAVEFFAPLLGRKTVRAYLERLTQAQTKRDYLQEMEVARGRLESWI